MSAEPVDLYRYTLPKPASREGWLAGRVPFVGASEVAALFDEHPFLSAGDLAVRKLHPEAEDRDSAAMARGRRYESFVAEWVAEERGLELRPPTVCYVVEGLIIATLDYEVVDAPAAVEIKTTAAYISAPERYWYWQCQAQLLATGYEWILIAAVDASLDLKTWTIHPDAEAFAAILDRSRLFLDAIQRGEIPEGAYPTYSGVQDLYPHAERTRVDLDDDAARIVEQLHILRRRLKPLLKDEDTLKAILAAKLAEATDGYVDGELVVTWRPITQHRVNVKALRASYPDIAEAFAEESTYRRLMLQ